MIKQCLIGNSVLLHSLTTNARRYLAQVRVVQVRQHVKLDHMVGEHVCELLVRAEVVAKGWERDRTRAKYAATLTPRALVLESDCDRPCPVRCYGATRPRARLSGSRRPRWPLAGHLPARHSRSRRRRTSRPPPRVLMACKVHMEAM